MMEVAVSSMDTAKSASSFLILAGVFEKIAINEKNKWLPYYHSSFCYAIAGSLAGDGIKTDAYLDKAQIMVDLADSLSPDESENYVLKALILSTRILVAPMIRGLKYSPESLEMLNIAERLNKENPRIYYLRGSHYYFTPKMMGGGKEKALPVLEQSVEKYKNVTPKSSLHPKWGEKQASQLMQKCQE
jgi:hypothetical protein